MAASKRIRKPPARRIAELRQFTLNLQLAIERFEKGERESISDILTNLRTLVGQRTGKNKGLFYSVADQFDLTCQVHGKDGEKIPFEEFMGNVQLTIRGVKISNSDFIWKYGSQIAAHSDEGIDPEYLEAENFHVGGVSTVEHIVLGIANTSRNVCAHLYQILEENGERLIKELKAAGKWK